MMNGVQPTYEAAEVRAGSDGLMRSKPFLSPILIWGLFVLLWT